MSAKVHSAQNPLRALFDGFAGSEIVIPSVQSLCPDWPLRIHPDLELIRGDFTLWVDHWFKDQRLRKKIEDLDAPLFAAMAYPETGREQLLTLAKFIAWYFPWDDAIDDGSLSHKPGQVSRYKDETIALVEQCLCSKNLQQRPHPNPAIQSFWDLGVAIRLKGTPETNQTLAKEQCSFITSSAQSQMEREFDEPVSVEQYLKRREENIAIYPLLGLIYYAYEFEVPAQFSHHKNKHMKIMWTELARMGTMGNDMLSVRRELMHGQFESLVPLLMFHEHLGPQVAMERAARMLHESYNRFNDAEQLLYAEVDSDSLDITKSFVQACKDLIMCNLHWSYGLKRYMEKGMLQPDGSVIFPISLSPSDHERKARQLRRMGSSVWAIGAAMALLATSVIIWNFYPDTLLV